MKLTSDNYRTYFERRLGRNLRATTGSVKCVFHDDARASLSINTERGVWKCHAGCGDGGLLEFEKKYSNCDSDAAWANISELLGVPQLLRGGVRIYAMILVLGLWNVSDGGHVLVCRQNLAR